MFSKDSLLILPFDHRTSLLKKLFGVEGRQATELEKQKFSALKEIVYDAFKLSLQNGVPKNHAGVLVDEEFGAKILQDAKKNGIIFRIRMAAWKLFLTSTVRRKKPRASRGKNRYRIS